MTKLILSAILLPAAVSCQTALTWQQVKEKFEAANPTLEAARLNINETRLQEITAYLRPNPTFSVGVDQIVPFSTQPSITNPNNQVYRPLQYFFPSYGIGYQIERDHKRELRLESARKSTEIAAATYADKERGLLFNLRNAFVEPCRPRLSSRTPRKTWIIGTGSSTSIASGWKRATWRRWTWTAWNCSACNSNPTWKPPW